LVTTREEGGRGRVERTEGGQRESREDRGREGEKEGEEREEKTREPAWDHKNP
jgi:hypothetical protein